MKEPQTETLDQEQQEFMLVLVFLFLTHRKYDDAKPLLDTLHKLYPKDYHVIRSMAYFHIETDQHEEAIKSAEAAMHPTMHPEERTFCLLVKSKALWRLGRAHEAKITIQQYLESRKTHS